MQTASVSTRDLETTNDVLKKEKNKFDVICCVFCTTLRDVSIVCTPMYCYVQIF